MLLRPGELPVAKGFNPHRPVGHRPVVLRQLPDSPLPPNDKLKLSKGLFVKPAMIQLKPSGVIVRVRR